MITTEAIDKALSELNGFRLVQNNLDNQKAGLHQEFVRLLFNGKKNPASLNHSPSRLPEYLAICTEGIWSGSAGQLSRGGLAHDVDDYKRASVRVFCDDDDDKYKKLLFVIRFARECGALDPNLPLESPASAASVSSAGESSFCAPINLVELPNSIGDSSALSRTVFQRIIHLSDGVEGYNEFYNVLKRGNFDLGTELLRDSAKEGFFRLLSQIEENLAPPACSGQSAQSTLTASQCLYSPPRRAEQSSNLLDSVSSSDQAFISGSACVIS